jgi:RNA polymerase sigma-70 factor (ECF subfamily)
LKIEVAADAEAVKLDRERQAVVRAQAGELSALEPVLAAHAEALLAIVLTRVGDRALAEDIIREVMTTALEKIGAFTWQGRSLLFWLRQIALHKVIDVHRQRGRSARLVEALRVEVEASAPPPAADDALIADEDRRRVLGRMELALAELPPRYADAIRLRLMEDRPRDACAAALAVTLGNFDVILFRAVRAFRKAYGEP